MNMKVLAGKIALVTGASRGIGRAVAERLAESGALVAVHYAGNEAAADEVVAGIERSGGRAFKLQAKFGEPGAVGSLVEALQAALLERTGETALDILVNNAGGGAAGAEFASVASENERDYDYNFDLNTKTPFFLSQALLPQLRSGGSVINVSSAAARLELVEFAAYSMAKAALESFTRILAKEIGPSGIRVNAVVPGFIRTDQSVAFIGDPENRKKVEGMTALRRVGEPADMAGVVHALVSPDMSYVTAQVIEVSGGYRL